jgi:predicted AlkP superfamily phosphohydrolase/phosphomutase
MDPGRIYLHHAGRFPLGEINPGQAADVRNRVAEVLSRLASKDGHPIIRRIFEKEAIYHGPYSQEGPDLVCLPFDGYDLKGNMRKNEIFSRGAFRGMHTRDNAVLVLPSTLTVPEQLNIEHPARFIRDYFSE